MMKRRAKRNTTNVFSGPRALQNYLDPGKNPDTPMVELPASMNPYLSEGVRIFVKMPPPFTTKAFAMLGMLNARSKRPGFKALKRVIIKSSGGAAAAMTLAARIIFNVPVTETVLPASIAPGKREFLRLCGARTFLDYELPDGYADADAYVKSEGKKDGVWEAPQYEDVTNIEGYGPLVKQCKRQTRNRMKIVSFGLGTSGLGNAFARLSDLICVGAQCSADDAVPGIRPPKRLRKVPLYKKKLFSSVVTVGTKAAYRCSIALCRIGLLLGPSSGAAYKAMLEKLKKLKRSGRLKTLVRANGGKLICVVIGHDSPFLYLEKYTTHLKDREVRPKFAKHAA
jgi:cysteine synthase